MRALAGRILRRGRVTKSGPVNWFNGYADRITMKMGKLLAVDLREVWKHEADDFTQWLAGNLDQLAEALDQTLEVIETEKKVDDSRFCIDILAEDDEGNRVIIENQLEKTDHSHLGQIITYATNMEAKTVIWIAKLPRQEHINAINWLNEFTDKKFHLVQVEAYKIDDSDPAPFFSVICRPSEESKSIGRSKKSLDAVREYRLRRRNASDTIIVPARKEGFEKVFLGEHCWYAIRIREKRIPQMKYIAAYQVAPTSAITHVAKIKEIVPYGDDGKYKVIFEKPAQKIKEIPIGEKSKLQGPAYCEYEKLKMAEDVDDLLSSENYEPEEEAA